MKIETRLLQLILSPITLDRVTIGLFHWDEINLRIASYLDYLNLYDFSSRDEVRKTAYSIINRAKVVKTIPNTVIDHFFKVRSGVRVDSNPIICYSPAHYQQYNYYQYKIDSAPPDTKEIFLRLCNSIWGNKSFKIEREF